MIFRWLPVLLVVSGGLSHLSAQDQPSATFAETSATVEADSAIWRMRAGLDAMAAGLPSLAEDIFSRMASDEGVEPAVRNRARLELVAALALQRRLREARGELSQVEPPYPDRFHLYQGLLHYAVRDYIGVEESLSRIEPRSLADEHRAWYFLLLSVDLTQRGDETGAASALEQARMEVTNSAQRAYIEAFRLSGRLLTGRVDEDVIEELEERLEDNQGTALGISFARQYAVALNLQGQSEAALEVLRRQLTTLSAAEADERAQLLLLVGLIAGPSSARGQVALLDILRTRRVPREVQQIALYQLASALRGASAEVQANFRTALDAIIDAGSTPLQDELLILRAYLRLEKGELEGASADATQLVDEYPGSGLRSDALYLLAYLAWTAETPRYRRAADYLTRLRDTIPPGAEQARMSRLIADCYFLKGDFQTAADAYHKALEDRERDQASSAEIRYQIVESLRRSGDLNGAATAARDPSWGWRDPHWAEANWNVIVALHQAGQLEQARQSASRLLASAPADSPSPVVHRLRWFSAYLAYRQGRWAIAQGSAQSAIDALSGDSVERGVQSALLAHNRLLLAQSKLRRGEVETALAELAALRQPGSNADAAVLAFFEEAHHYARDFRLADAQLLLRQLADTYPNHPNAPAALLEAAMMADRQAIERTQREALDILASFLERYPQHPLVFQVLRLQGDIARKLNRFDLALEYYNRMVERFEGTEQPLYLAHLAAANCLLAMTAREPGRADLAIARLDRVLSDPGAPVDAQAEASFLLGTLYAQQNNRPRAREVYWQATQRFLLDGANARQLGAKGRYWLGRSLAELAELFLADEEIRSAIETYRLIAAYGLPGRRVAQVRIGQLRADETP